MHKKQQNIKHTQQYTEKEFNKNKRSRGIKTQFPNICNNIICHKTKIR